MLSFPRLGLPFLFKSDVFPRIYPFYPPFAMLTICTAGAMAEVISVATNKHREDHPLTILLHISQTNTHTGHGDVRTRC
jgi:hypothetical protein